jgi:predicted DNA-binding transcriptional regulator AlpA
MTDYLILTTEQLAEKRQVKVSWVIDHSCRSKTSDPIPVWKIGKHRRYRWGSPELEAWLQRRCSGSRKAGSR